MIRSWSGKEAEQLWQTGKSRRLPPETIKRALAKLQSLNAAPSVDHLSLPPANPAGKPDGRPGRLLEHTHQRPVAAGVPLRDGDAFDVSIVDYH